MSLAIGIDVGGTTIKSALVSRSGAISATHTSATPKDLSLILDQVAEHVDMLAAQATHRGDNLEAAVGIVVPGVVDEETGTAVLSANLGWRDVPMQELLVQRLGRSVRFGHDVRAGALAEFAAAELHDTQVYVAIGTGIAAVTKLGTRILVNSGWAGELGQVLVLDPDTGRRVTLERVSSAISVGARYSAHKGLTQPVGSHEVFVAASSGDPVAREVVNTAIEYLAEALAHVSCLLGSTHFIIGGGMSQAGPALLEPLTLATNALLEVTPEATFAQAKLGASSQIIGAAMLAFGTDKFEVDE